MEKETQMRNIKEEKRFRKEEKLSQDLFDSVSHHVIDS